MLCGRALNTMTGDLTAEDSVDRRCRSRVQMLVQATTAAADTESVLQAEEV